MKIDVRRNVHTGKVTGFRDAETGADLGKFAKSGLFCSLSQKFSDWLQSQGLPTELVNRDGIPYKEISTTSRVGDDVRGSVITKTWQEFHVDTIVEFESVKIRVSSKMVGAKQLENLLDYLHDRP